MEVVSSFGKVPRGYMSIPPFQYIIPNAAILDRSW